MMVGQQNVKIQKSKITAKTDKNCGNESKNRHTSKHLLFYATIFTLQSIDQKTC